MPEVPGMTTDGLCRKSVKKSWSPVTCVTALRVSHEAREVNPVRKGWTTEGVYLVLSHLDTINYNFFLMRKRINSIFSLC